MSDLLNTLLEHPAMLLESGEIQMSPRPPEGLRDFALAKLAQNGIAPERWQFAMREVSKQKRVAHDAAWLFFHASCGLQLIEAASPGLRTMLRQLWAHAFHAGERHEGITVNLRHLPAVQAQHRRRNELPAKARAAKKERITVDQYRAATLKARSRKQLFALLGQSGQGVRDFERRHPDLKTK